MDAQLQERLDKWHSHIGVVEDAERKCLELEGNEKSLWASLFILAIGKTVPEKEAWVYSHQSWKDFQAGLAEARTIFNRERRILELKQSAFQATYLERKMTGEAIQRMPRVIA